MKKFTKEKWQIQSQKYRFLMTPPPPPTHTQPHIPAQLAAKTLGRINERREAGRQAEENSANIYPMSKNCYISY